MTPRTAVRWVLLAGLAVGLASCSSDAPTPPRHLVLLTVDTLRADHMSLYGYPRATSPAAEDIARTGATFDRAIAQWPKTGTSFASIFSGLYPRTTGLTHKAALQLPTDLETLPQLLREEGFVNVAVVSNPVLSHELGWDQHFDEYLETWSGVQSDDPFVYRPQLAAPRVVELSKDLIERHSNADRLFVWLHFSDPHAPYVLPPGRENPFADDALAREAPDVEPDLTGTRGREIPGVSSLRDYVSLYDANVLETDRGIDAVRALLEAAGIWSEAAIVLTADHGESLGEHGLYFEHGPLPHNPGVHVPLVLAGEHIEPGLRLAEPVDLVDLLPTLCPWLDLPCPAVLDGASLWPVLRRDTDPETAALAFSEAGYRPHHVYSVQSESLKLVFHSRRGAPFDPQGRFELFDLQQDPDELHDLLEAQPDRARPLLRELREWLERPPLSERQESPLTPAQKRALEAMGYTTN